MTDRVAELRYEFGDSVWIAAVSRSADGFRLRISKHGAKAKHPTWRDAGLFQTGSACARFVRDLAAKKFKGWTPTVDTLGVLQGTFGKSVVPLCFYKSGNGEGRGRAECPDCPYKTECGEPASGKEAAPLPEEGEVPQEDDSTFLERLKSKMSAQYGGGHGNE